MSPKLELWGVFKVFRKFIIADLVARLKLSVVLSVFLDSIVRQMDELIVCLFGRVFFAWCSDVTFVEPKGSKHLGWRNILTNNKHSNIKFSAVKKKRFVNVSLQNNTRECQSNSSYYFRELSYAFAKVYACTSISVFTWFHNPDLSFYIDLCFKLDELISFIWLLGSPSWNQICFWYYFKWIPVLGFVVLAQITEQHWLICQVSNSI